MTNKLIVTLEKSGLFPPYSNKGGDKVDWQAVRDGFNGWPTTVPPRHLVKLLADFEAEGWQIVILSTMPERFRPGLVQWSGLLGPTYRVQGQPGERQLVLREDYSDKPDLQWKAETIAQLSSGEEVFLLVDSDEELVPLLPDNVACYDSLEAVELLPKAPFGTGTAARR